MKHNWGFMKSYPSDRYNTNGHVCNWNNKIKDNKHLNPLTDGGGHRMPPPSQISSCASGIHFWVALKWWQLISVHILLGYYPSRAKNCIEKVLEYHFWGKGHFSRSMKGIFLKLQSYVRGQNRGFWGWPTKLDPSQVCSTCISRAYTCIHVIYTCYTPENGLVMLAILKIPYFDPSYTSVTSEIFLSLILKNDPCLKNGILKLFQCNFWCKFDGLMLLQV